MQIDQASTDLQLSLLHPAYRCDALARVTPRRSAISVQEYSGSRVLAVAGATGSGPWDLASHSEKTKIEFRRDANRRGSSEHTSIDSRDYGFQGRLAHDPRSFSVSFSAAVGIRCARLSGRSSNYSGEGMREPSLGRRRLVKFSQDSLPTGNYSCPSDVAR
jgi:hypothetical protein